MRFVMVVILLTIMSAAVLAQVEPSPPYPEFGAMTQAFGNQFNSKADTIALQDNFLKTDIGVEFDHIPIGIGPGPDGLEYFRKPLDLNHFGPGPRHHAARSRPFGYPGGLTNAFAKGIFDKTRFGRL